jgi:RNA polymerase sigma-70 factor, ECF subfamily
MARPLDHYRVAAADPGSSNLEPASATMPIYCLVAGDFPTHLLDLLRRHFGENPSVSVVVEARRHERRENGRRTVGAERAGQPRLGERRAPVVEVQAPPLSRRLRRHAERLRFVQRVEPSGREAEDVYSSRLVVQAQRGDAEAFAALYVRHFNQVYSYLRMALRDRHDAEDLAQQVFLKAFAHLNSYEVRPDRSFRPWLFRIARNQLIDHVRKERPALLEDPERVADRQTRWAEGADVETLQSTLAWLSDSEVTLFIERLPLAQRQVITLRYMIGLTVDEVADVLGRSPGSIRQLDYRARQYLQARLTALGRKPVVRRRALRAIRRQVHVLRERRFALLR